MRKIIKAISTSLTLIATCAPVSAASLQVTPINIEVAAPGAATTVTLNNPGTTPLKAQIRVYRWSLVNGQEHLEPATDVIASPPVAALQPKTDYTVRLVRLSKQPVTVEETYRLLIDEIPDKSNASGVVVAMAFRYSIPVFFTPANPGNGALTWSATRQNGKLFVSATNSGTRRVRLADLSVGDGNGKSTVIAKGLAGYVLARSSKSWVAPDVSKSANSPLLIEAQGDNGPINASALPQNGR